MITIPKSGFSAECRCRCAVYEENAFRVDPDQLAACITGRTKLLLLNTPSNPTGAVLDGDILSRIAELAVERDLMVLSDEPYEHIMFDGVEHVSMGSLPGMAQRTIGAYTLSKSYAMTGWRVGVCRGSVIPDR